jgi:hypothetical protein
MVVSVPDTEPAIAEPQSLKITQETQRSKSSTGYDKGRVSERGGEGWQESRNLEIHGNISFGVCSYSMSQFWRPDQRGKEGEDARRREDG